MPSVTHLLQQMYGDLFIELEINVNDLMTVFVCCFSSIAPNNHSYRNCSTFFK